jgi:signal transduction histidine kinase
MAGFLEASNALHRLLDTKHLAAGPRYHVELVFEEIASNIVRHAFPTGDVEVTIAFDDEIVLTFEDDGVPFDPRKQRAPAMPESIEEARAVA